MHGGGQLIVGDRRLDAPPVRVSRVRTGRKIPGIRVDFDERTESQGRFKRRINAARRAEIQQGQERIVFL